MPKMVSLRLDEELLEWADGYAKERGVSRTEVVAEALRSLREDSERSVPDLPALKGAWADPVLERQLVQPDRSIPGVITGAVLARRQVDPTSLARQERLNKAKYG